MAYTEQEYKHYIKKPKQIHGGLDEELLLALVDVNSSWFSYMKPHTLDFVKRVIAIDPTTFPYADRSVFTIQYLEEVITATPMLIQYVYEPNDTLIKIALEQDLNILSYLGVLDKNIYKWIVEKNGLMLAKIPPTEQTEEIVEIAIRQNYKAYKTASFKNLFLDRIAIEADNSMVQYISDYHPELIESILEYNPMLLSKFVGMVELTDELIRTGISKNSQVYKLIPYPDIELMKYSALIDLTLMDCMPYSDELIEYILERNGLALEYVKKKELFVIKKAVTQNVLALNFVENPRQHLIDYAFEIDGIAIQFIDNPTAEQCTYAIKDNGYAIEFVPFEYQTADLQLRALSECGAEVIPFIKPISDDVILEILRIEPAYIFSIEEPTDAMYISAFEANGQLIKFYDDWTHFFNNDILTATMSGDGSLLEYIDNKTASMIYAAIDNFPVAIKWVEHQTTEMARLALEIDPRVLYYIHQSVMVEELLDLAISIDPDYFTRIAGELTWTQWLKLLELKQGE